MGGFGQMVVLVKKVNGIAQKIAVGAEDMVAVGFVFLRRLLVGGADFGDDGKVRAELEFLGKWIGNEATALEAELHGLINDAAQSDKIVLLDLGWVLFGVLQAF